MSDSLQRLQFDEFVLDEGNALLTRGGQPVALPARALALLCALTRQPGRPPRSNDLLDAVWGDRYVSESVLKTTVSQVRAALADDAGEPRYIETVSRHGYRFIGRVSPTSGALGPAAATGTRTVRSRRAHRRKQQDVRGGLGSARQPIRQRGPA